MSAQSTTTTTTRREPPAERGVLQRRRRKQRIGSFRDEEGNRQVCWLAQSKAGIGLVFVLGPEGPAKCLCWVGDCGLLAQAEAVFASYVTAEAESRSCRAVSRSEAEAL